MRARPIAVAVAWCVLALPLSVSAADLAVRAPVAAPAAAPAVSWSGFYGGVNVGYGWADRSASLSATGTSTANFIKFFGGSINPTGFTTNGAVAGVQAGYNWQFAPSWLVGLETDFQGSNISGQTSANFTNIVTMTVAAKE